MYQRVKEYIQKNHMLNREDKVVAGVSGGADSICLLFMLIELRKELGFDLSVVHVHHGLRGESADADAAYVDQVCREQGIKLHVFYENVRDYARERGLTMEEAGREVRRRDFCRVAEETGGTKIALAHHQNDNAETLLWNLCRGCGLKGMGGIAPEDGLFIHPLLCLQRQEIETYLAERRISYCTDETNLEDDYTRNRIRNHVIPYLEKEINGQTVLHISEMTEQMRRIGAYMEQEAAAYEKTSVRYTEDGAAVLQKELYERVPEALRSDILYRMLCRVAGRKKDIERKHIRMLADLLTKQVGRRMEFPYGVNAVRCYEGIEIKQSSGKIRNEVEEDREESECPAHFRIFDRTPDMRIFPEKPYTKWFDYDIIKNTVKIRHREPGDYITIDSQGNTQKLSRYFINEKIPEKDRDRIYLAADGQQVMWIIGYRQSQNYQITEKTRRILEIHIDGGRDDGRAC